MSINRVMPESKKFHCNKCDLTFPTGSGGYPYVINKIGKKRIAKKPGEMEALYGSLGKDAPKELVEKMVGFNSHCICVDCLKQFGMDVEKEARGCPQCYSNQIKTVLELVGNSCPKCKTGTIVAENE